jgi:hypothetical protein
MKPLRIVLELVPLADPRPVEIRLRVFLKRALRSFALRCVRAEVVAHDQTEVAHNPKCGGDESCTS